jgi:hypothetical protein
MLVRWKSAVNQARTPHVNLKVTGSQTVYLLRQVTRRRERALSKFIVARFYLQTYITVIKAQSFRHFKSV